MNHIIRRAQTCTLVAVLFCAPNALAMKQFKTLPITNNPEAKDTAQNILVGPATVLKEGDGDSGTITLLNNELLAIFNDEKIKIWDLASGEYKYYLTAIASHDSRGIVKLWNSKNGVYEKALAEGWPNTMIISSEIIIAQGDNDSISIFDRRGKCNFLKNLTGHTKSILDLILVKNNILISCSYDKTIKIWDLNKGFWVQSINCDDCVRKIFITTIQNVPTLVAVTYYGAIITCPCNFDTKDLKFFYKNLDKVISNKKKKSHFEDLGINFN